MARVKKISVLVCGGAGYIGSHVVRHLVGAGYDVTVFDNFSLGHPEAIPEDVDCVQGSVMEAGVLDRMFSNGNFDAVFHLCAFTMVGESVRDPLRYYENNVGGGVQLLKAMATHGVKRMVFSSTAAVYGQPEKTPIDESCAVAPINPYGFSKLCFERILSDCDTAWGLKWVALRYFNAAGADATSTIGEDHTPETHLIPLTLFRALPSEVRPADAHGPLQVFGNDYPTPDGTCVRDYVHVTDLADAHQKALAYLAGGGNSIAVNLGNGSGFSVLEVIRSCEEITGQKIPFEVTARRPGDPATLVASAERASQALQWKTSHSSLENIVATAWRWHQAHPSGFRVK